MRVGLVCPYTWDVPGGVQAHVSDLALALLGLGHDVSVITPADDDSLLPPHIVSTGRAVPVPYNGAVARMAFGPLSARRVRRWLRDGDFDVVHVHEPTTPSLSLLATWSFDGPLVATFHTSIERSRTLAAMYPILQTALEKISGRIAVSESARRTLVEHLGGDAVLIPNGVSVASFAGVEPLPGWPGSGGALGFLGRLGETRKGLPVLLSAFEKLAVQRPGLRLLIAGPGDLDEVRSSLPDALVGQVELLGLVSDADKARMLRSVDVYVAPNTGGESFGIVLLEAMAVGTPVLASDLEAFRAVLDGGRAGVLFATGDADDLAARAAQLLDDPATRAELTIRGLARARVYDWSTVARDIVRVYETVAFDGTTARGRVWGR
ncbi:MAG: phosphatidyl-myo-inositol alpha-mannosyltransferase [Actinomycetota bacterium]|nr:phosphatidyl-myo-inositol alpha-mannosyltransferase [Actinomycetota bacterium]